MPHYPLAEQLREREHVLAAFDELLAKNFHTAPGVAAARGRRRRKYRKPANGTRPCAFDHSHLVELVRAGMCTSAIAQRLCTSQKTVRVIAQRAGLSIRSPQESDAG